MHDDLRTSPGAASHLWRDGRALRWRAVHPRSVTRADDQHRFLRADVVHLAQACHARGWAPATAGNFSVRRGDLIAITASAKDKGAIDQSGVVLIDPSGAMVEPSRERASAETALHLALYRRDPNIGAVAHTHSLAGVVLSRLALREAGTARRRAHVLLDDYELLKAFHGVNSHAHALRVPVLANTQDLDALAGTLDAILATSTDARLVPAFLVGGHGAYTWGADLPSTLRHVEALETLLSYALEEARLGTTREAR